MVERAAGEARGITREFLDSILKVSFFKTILPER
jgi:hypothetical protein